MEASRFYKNLPKTPGVYLFKDKKRNVIYIGKAINLKNRVKNHFTDNKDNLKHQNLVPLIDKVDFQTVSSDMEALLLEARLIKQYRPKYNSLLKDDKRYLYVGISKEKYPKIYLLRKPEIEENLADWFGPFPTAQSLKEILRLIRRIFPYRTCKSQTSSTNSDKTRLPQKSCLYYHLRLCPAPCINQIQNYSQTVRKIRLFLNGEIKPLLGLLTKQMISLSENLKFEEAQVVKRQIEAVLNLLAKRPKSADEARTSKRLEELKNLLIKYQGFDPFIIHRLEAFDVSNLGKQITVGSMVVFTGAEPDPSSYRQFKIIDVFQNDVEALKQIISRRCNHPEWIFPQVMLVDGGKGQVTAAWEALKVQNLAGKIGLLGLAKEEERIIIPRIYQDRIINWQSLRLASGSPVLQLLQHLRDESHRFAQRYYRRLHQKSLLSNQTTRKNTFN